MKVADIYCGIGGLSEGVKQAGHEIVFGLDNDPSCVDGFRLNNPDTEVWCRDARTVEQVPFKVDMVVGSPPCPTFSVANAVPAERTGDLELTNNFFRLVKLFNAKYWLMENVPPIKKFFPRGRVLNSYDYGVPQKRRRCFVSNFFFTPEPCPKINMADVLDVREDAFMVDSRVAHFSEDKVEFPVNGPAPTLTTKCNGFHFIQPHNLHRNLYSPDVADSVREHLETIYTDQFFDVRRITVEESLRLQGFPRDYKLPSIKETKRYEMIGNAVPPPLAKAIVNGATFRTLREVFG